VLLDVTKAAGTEGRNAADFRPDLAAIRAMSAVLPGALPLAVNGVRVAASIRPRKFVIEGGDDTAVAMPRTAFQIVYPDCSVMIDSGLDKPTHDSFSPDSSNARSQRRASSCSPTTTPTTWRACYAHRIFPSLRGKPSSPWASRIA
jgi:hypothetical protein